MNPQNGVSFILCCILFSFLILKLTLANPTDTNTLSTEKSVSFSANTITSSAIVDTVHSSSTEAIPKTSTKQANSSKSHENSTSTTINPIKILVVNVSRSGLSNIDKKVQRAINDVSAAFNSTDRSVRKVVEKSLLQTSSAFVNNSASAISNTVDFLSKLKNNLVQQMTTFQTDVLKNLESSATRTQKFFLENLGDSRRSVERIKNGSTESLRSFKKDVANLTTAINNGLRELTRKNGSANEMMRKSVGDIFSNFRNRQMNFQDSLLALKTQARETFQSTLTSIKAGWQDVVSRSQMQFQALTNGLLSLFSVGLNTLKLPFQKNVTNTNM